MSAGKAKDIHLRKKDGLESVVSAEQFARYSQAFVG
jgi:hypothetical protein